MVFLVLLAGLLALLALWRWLHGDDLSGFDRGYPVPVAGNPPSAAAAAVVEDVLAFTRASAAGGNRPGRGKIAALRAAMDAISADRDFASEIRPAAQGGPAGEWVLPPAGDVSHRLLYIHGGAFIAGSPRSHRIITDRIARETGAAVFVLDYRLLPEHSRADMAEDCLDAWRWLVANGPDGPAPANQLAVAGDSAGGALTLWLLAALRDRALTAPAAAVALCPITDYTLSSPSLRFNVCSDGMLGPSFGRFMAMHPVLRSLSLWLAGRRSPADPMVSPVRGRLSGLAPVLLQVSTTEMLLDDAARYYHKMTAEGGAAVLETYANMEHVWHIFAPQLPEAEVAFAHIRDFLASHGFGVPAAQRVDAA